MPQRDRLSYGLSAGSLPERAAAARRLPKDIRGEDRGGGRRRTEGEEEEKRGNRCICRGCCRLRVITSSGQDLLSAPPPHQSSSSPSSSRPPLHFLLFLMTMPGWRRNLTFCLQRMHEEGRKAKQINVRLCVCARARLCVLSRGVSCCLNLC